MTTADNYEFDDKISTANVDVSATQLLDDRYVATRGKNTSATINQTITFTVVLQLQNHGLKHMFQYKSPERRYFWQNSVAGEIYDVLVT